MITKPVYFKNLDAIRCIAALMVYMQHGVRGAFDYLPIHNYWVSRVVNVIMSGSAGVAIFFVLSGFLITFLLVTEAEQTGKIDLKKFYVRRILRIWPLYFAVIVYSFVVYPVLKMATVERDNSAANIFYYISFLANFDVMRVELYFPEREMLSQVVLWSVAIEEQFYAFWPLIFALLPQRKWGHAIVAVIVLSLVFRGIHYNEPLMLQFHTVSVLVYLAMGGLLAFMIKTSKKAETFFASSSQSRVLFFMLLPFILLLFMDSIVSFKYGNAIYVLLTSVAYSCFVASQALTTNRSKLALGQIKLLAGIGVYTYGIYLLHPIVLTALEAMLNVAGIQKNNFATYMLAGVFGLIVTLLVSKMSYHFFEKKFLQLKQRFTVVQSGTH